MLDIGKALEAVATGHQREVQQNTGNLSMELSQFTLPRPSAPNREKEIKFQLRLWCSAYVPVDATGANIEHVRRGMAKRYKAILYDEVRNALLRIRYDLRKREGYHNYDDIDERLEDVISKLF